MIAQAMGSGQGWMSHQACGNSLEAMRRERSRWRDTAEAREVIRSSRRTAAVRMPQPRSDIAFRSLAQGLGRGHDACAVASLEPAVASVVAEHREIAVGVAGIVPLAIRLGHEFVNAVFGMGKDCQGNRMALRGQRFESTGGRGAGRFKIVLPQYP